MAIRLVVFFSFLLTLTTSVALQAETKPAQQAPNSVVSSHVIHRWRDRLCRDRVHFQLSFAAGYVHQANRARSVRGRKLHLGKVDR